MRYLKIFFLFSAILLATGLVAGAGAYYYFTRDLPDLTRLHDYHPNLITRVYARDGQIIGEFYIERRIVVPINKMPEHLIEAMLAAEDSKFFEHEGIDYLGIFRALYKNIRAGRIVQGGSTITQQVAKSFFLSSEKKLSRKIREAIMAYRIEKQLTKEEILHLYLNQIYFGNGAYGVQAASETYFGKDVEDLDLSEAALLAGLPKAPSRYSPYSNPDLARERQEFILTRMLEEGFISLEEAEKALNKPLKLKPKERKTLWVGPYFTEHVRRYIEEKYGEDALYKGGLNVYTTLDVDLQKAANEAVSHGLRKHDKRRGYRGPVMTLKTIEGIESFREEMQRKLEKRPLSVGKIYKGVVTSIDRKAKTLSVAIGNYEGVIEYADMSWARNYNPTQDPEGGKTVDPINIFNIGDVIEVLVKALPDNAASPIPLKLEQEPLAQAALLAMEPESGYVRAMVGGFDFSKSQFNRAVQARRQPGSAFKPIIYAAALDKNYTPATIVVDSPLVFEDKNNDMEWKPRNFEEKFHGPTTIREALTKSRNVVTVKVLRDIGVNYAISYARKLGIKSELSRDLSLALGSSAVSLLEMTVAYSTFANMGWRPEPVFITKITDREGNVLEERRPRSEPVLSPQTAYIMTNLLQGVIENGTGWRAKALGRPAAGKTGTTNNLNDAWFIGYVPGLVAGAWIGYDDEKPLGKMETGSRAALPIWLKFMKAATEGTPPENFPMPDGMEFAKIDPETGLLAGPSTKNPVFEVFKVGTAPREMTKDVEDDRAMDFFLMDYSEKPERPGVEQEPENITILE